MKQYIINLKEGLETLRIVIAFPILLFGMLLKDVGESISGLSD